MMIFDNLCYTERSFVPRVPNEETSWGEEMMGRSDQTSLKIAVLGVNLDFETTTRSGLQIALVVADRGCPGICRAEAAHLQVEIMERIFRGPNFDRDTYTARLITQLQLHRIDVIVMAGPQTTPGNQIFGQNAFSGRILNLHTSAKNAVTDAPKHVAIIKEFARALVAGETLEEVFL